MISILLICALLFTIMTTANAAIISNEAGCDASQAPAKKPTLEEDVNQASDEEVLKVLELLQVRAKQIANK